MDNRPLGSNSSILWNINVNTTPKTGAEIRDWCYRTIEAGTPFDKDLAASLINAYFENEKVYPPNPDKYYFVLYGRNAKEPLYVLVRDRVRSPKFRRKEDD